MKLLNIGFDNYVPSNVVISLIRPDSAPVKRKIDEARKNDMLVDATFGRKTKSVIITKSNHIILSAIKTETIARRFNDNELDIDDSDE